MAFIIVSNTLFVVVFRLRWCRLLSRLDVQRLPLLLTLGVIFLELGSDAHTRALLVLRGIASVLLEPIVALIIARLLLIEAQSALSFAVGSGAALKALVSEVDLLVALCLRHQLLLLLELALVLLAATVSLTTLTLLIRVTFPLLKVRWHALLLVVVHWVLLMLLEEPARIGTSGRAGSLSATEKARLLVLLVLLALVRLLAVTTLGLRATALRVHQLARIERSCANIHGKRLLSSVLRLLTREGSSSTLRVLLLLLVARFAFTQLWQRGLLTVSLRAKKVTRWTWLRTRELRCLVEKASAARASSIGASPELRSLSLPHLRFLIGLTLILLRIIVPAFLL